MRNYWPFISSLLLLPPLFWLLSQNQETPDPSDAATTAVSDQIHNTAAIPSRVNLDEEALSLDEFAGRLAPSMDHAMKSETGAQSFFPQLRECVEATAVVRSPKVRSICLMNAARLAQRYPGRLGADFEKLWKQTPGKITGIIQ
jgi:hypothetical protein